MRRRKSRYVAPTCRGNIRHYHYDKHPRSEWHVAPSYGLGLQPAIIELFFAAVEACFGLRPVLSPVSLRPYLSYLRLSCIRECWSFAAANHRSVVGSNLPSFSTACTTAVHSGPFDIQCACNTCQIPDCTYVALLSGHLESGGLPR